MIKKLLQRIRPQRQDELDYESIVMDSMNLPRFDRHHMEGVIERSITREAFIVMIGIFVCVIFIYILRLGSLQIVRGAEYRALAENNRLSAEVLFNKRGILYDRQGRELAWNVFIDERDFPTRRYFAQPGLAHLVGYVSYPQQDTDGNYFSTEYVGISGLEYAYGERLNGQLGREVREVDALGQTVSAYAIESPVPGENIYLSVDAKVQSKLHQLLSTYIQEQGFLGGAGVIMDVETGEIIALTSVPEFDSNILSDGQDRQTIAQYNTDEGLPFLNRVTGGSFAPGSIVKIFIAAGILDQDIISPDYQLLTDGALEVPNQYGAGFTIFRDARNNGWVDMYDAIALSSNIYFMTFGGGFEPHQGLGIHGMNDYLGQFGLGEKTGIKEFRELAGNVPSPEWKRETFNEGWLLANTYFTAIGQYAFLATPLQAVVATAAVANGGEILVPQLELASEKVVRKRVGVSEADLEIVREAMRQTVVRGTTQSLNLPFVEVATKSGTAERGVRNNLINSWAVGFWPYEKPRYAFVLLAEQGPRTYQLTVSRVMTSLLNWMETEDLSSYY